ncbi:MAG: cobalamin biosynthesis protein CobQ [Mogibacterium sp.]|nr:cobalamin biosynthesis protein CobQ [Mogibacterium sp.]
MIRTAWMYPDTLYLHGERGTVMALERMAAAMGAEMKTDKIDLGAGYFDPMDYEILFYGPGEIPSFEAVIKEISAYRERLREFVESGRVLLVTGSSVGMFCRSVGLFGDGKAADGSRRISGLGLIPADALEREYVFGDDELIDAVYNGRQMELLGNQIQMLDIYTDESEGFGSFGRVRYGRGNNGVDGSEGMICKNSVFTNMTGPLLVGNPWLTEEMIRCAAEASGIKLPQNESAAPDRDHDLEKKSLELKKAFIKEKAAHGE